MNDLAADIARRVPELAHLQPERVLFAIARSRAEGTHGVYARIIPLRFAEGNPETVRQRGRYRETFRMPALTHGGRDILYVIHIMMPRFLRLSFSEKLNTLVHELYHISERCDGDIRRFPGRNYAHGHSRKAFNRTVAALCESYLKSGPAPDLLSVLRLEEAAWQRREFRLTGLTVPLPRARLVARERF